MVGLVTAGEAGLGPLMEVTGGLMAGTDTREIMVMGAGAPGRTSLDSPSQPGISRGVRGERIIILLVTAPTTAGAAAACWSTVRDPSPAPTRAKATVAAGME